MKFNLKKISIVGLVGVFFVSAIMCCCFTDTVQAVEDKRYCVDILTQLSAVSSAVGSVQDNILSKHLDTCVSKAFMGESKIEKMKKIDEVIKLLKTFRKNG